MKTSTYDQMEVSILGKKYRLFRVKGGKWAVRVRHQVMNPNGSVKVLGTAVAQVAVKNARFYIEKLLANDWTAVDAMKSRPSVPTIGEIVDEYRKSAAELELQLISVTSSVNALLNVVSVARNCSKEKARDIPITLLNSDLIATYWKAVGLENRVTAASRLNKAQAVFSTRALEVYKRRWRLPDLNEFRTAPKLRRRISDQTFQEFSADIAGQIEWAAQQIRQADPDTYRVYLLAARLGLRDNEIVNARGDWIVERRGKWALTIIDRPQQPFLTKAGVQRWLELSEELVEEFRSEIGTNRYLVANGKSPTARQDAVYRTASAFVRRHLPGRSKSLYELRKYAGARIATEHGLYAAKEFLGHATVSTTEKHYAAYLKNVGAVSAVPMVPLISAADVDFCTIPQ